MKISRLAFFFVTFLVAFAAAAALGCTGTSPYMAPTTSSAVEMAPEMATVVFVRPSQHGGAARVTLMDGKGRFLGDTMPGTHFAVKMPPGEHLFISWGEITSSVKATLAAGKVYFVEAYSPTGPGSPFLALRAVTLSSSSWAKVDEWVTHTQGLKPNEEQGQAYLRGAAGGVESAIRKGNTVFAGYDAKELPEHTIAVEDGK